MKGRATFAEHVVRVPVKGSPYDVIVGKRMLRHLGPTLRAYGIGSDIVILTDTRVGPIYLERIRRHLATHGFRTVPVILPQGESQKSLESASKVFATMLRNGIGRGGTVLALGGGVIGDLAGFVAATYHRGIALVHVPTTLLSQVDSSIGGKVAVNHELGKNMIGAFYQPKLVWTDVAYLRTLPAREITCGLGEIIKYGVIRDAKLFAWLEANVESVLRGNGDSMLHVQATCSAIKASICGKDERETGVRVILNYGHTVGHALESAGGYRTVKHGEGVLLGMKAETWIARELGMIPDAVCARIVSLIEQVPLYCSTASIRPAAVMNAMKRDKKSRSGLKRFVLPRRIGAVEVVEGVTDKLILQSLKQILG